MSIAIEQLPQRSDEQKKSREGAARVEKKTFKDSEGKTICRAEITLDKATVPIPDDRSGAQGRILNRIVLSGEKDGQPAKIDLLPFLGIDKLGFHTYAVQGKWGIDYHKASVDTKQRVVVSGLEDPIDIAALLHEYGHAIQFHDPRFQTVYHFRNLENTEHLLANTFYPVAAEMKKMLAQVNYKPEEQEAQLLKELEETESRLLSAQVNKDMKSDELQKIQSASREGGARLDVQKIKSLEKEISSLLSQVDFEKKLREHYIAMLENLRLLPGRMLERNAWAWALLRMRDLKRQGINLLKIIPRSGSIMTKEEQKMMGPRGGESTETSGEKVSASLLNRLTQAWDAWHGNVSIEPRELIKRALETYGGDTRSMRQSYENKIPMPHNSQFDIKKANE